MGVHYDKTRNKYRVTVVEQGKRRYIGQFDTKRKGQNALAKYREELEKLNTIDLHSVEVPYMDMSMKKPVFNSSKLSLMSRIKAKIAVWQKKLNEL